MGAAGFPVADLGDEINQSLRFPTNAGSERLEWATGPSATTSWTVSFWMKLGQVGLATDGTIWQASGASSGPGLYINHNSAAGSDQGVLRDPNNGYSSGRSLRDPSAWYHVVHTFHASGGTNRVRIYVNGETALDTTGVGATIDPGKFRIGGNAQWPQPQFQGYMAEWHFVSDNGNLTAADFGRTNDDGIWVPKTYTGSHGSDGFHLDFADSSDLGNDVSGNNNDFTASNFDTADIKLYHPLIDTSDTGVFSNNPASNGPQLAFDGDSGTAYNTGGPGTIDMDDLGADLGTGVSTIVVRNYPRTGTNTLTVNSTTATASGNSDQDITINHDGSAITTFSLAGTDTGYFSLLKITIDGTELVNNTDNDVDYLDTPTSNYATLNPLVASSSATFSNANLTYAASTTLSDYAVGTMAMKDKCYWETEIIAGTNIGVGIGEITDTSADSYLGGTGGDTHGYGFNGQILTGAVASSTQATYTTGDIIGQAYDPETGKWWVAKNGTWQNSGDPASGSGQVATVASASRTIMTPGINPYSSTHRINYGQMPFLYTAPTGFKALQTNNLPEPTIKNGKEHFEAIIWDGNDVDDRAITTTEEFAPDLVWIKCRDSAINHFIYDTVRDAPNRLFPNLTNAEDTGAGHLKSFTSTGFTLGTSGNVNGTGNDYVAWCWKAGGTAVSNTDGTITSSVSANTDAGFSIVSYTGNLTAGATVGHGLTSAPELIMVKSRDFTQTWHVKHSGTGNNTDSLSLDTAAAGINYNAWNNTAPTSSVFSLGPIDGTNKSGEDYIAYCWHSVEGFSKFGSYEGNGSSDGTFVYLGFTPSLIICKNIDAANGWAMFDTTRDPANDGDQHALFANDPGDETGSYNIDLLSNGFKCRDTSGDFNGSSTYVYMAFASNPFGGENAPPVTAR